MLMVSSAAVERNAIIGDDAGMSTLSTCSLHPVTGSVGGRQRLVQTDRGVRLNLA